MKTDPTAELMLGEQMQVDEGGRRFTAEQAVGEGGIALWCGAEA
ncbi:hypothetical protein [Synechococcus sp. WH 5701]|nr:hypothetical protein [Synechococcus sp. WH 5701]